MSQLPSRSVAVTVLSIGERRQGPLSNIVMGFRRQAQAIGPRRWSLPNVSGNQGTIGLSGTVAWEDEFLMSSVAYQTTCAFDFRRIDSRITLRDRWRRCSSVVESRFIYPAPGNLCNKMCPVLVLVRSQASGNSFKATMLLRALKKECQELQEMKILTVCKRCRTDEVCTSFWIGKLNQPLKEKIRLRKD